MTIAERQPSALARSRKRRQRGAGLVLIQAVQVQARAELFALSRQAAQAARLDRIGRAMAVQVAGGDVRRRRVRPCEAAVLVLSRSPVGRLRRDHAGGQATVLAATRAQRPRLLRPQGSSHGSSPPTGTSW